jgi:F-type H+-transporting ATPase subunit b
MPQFDVTTFPGQIFWLFLLFGVLYLLVNFLIAPKARDIINQRADAIEENIKQSQQLANEVQLLQEQKDKIDSEKLQKIEIIQNDALKIVDSYLQQQEKELSALANLHHQNLIAKIKDQANIFKNNESEHYLKLAAMMIEKITNSKTDLAILNDIYSKIK